MVSSEKRPRSVRRTIAFLGMFFLCNQAKAIINIPGDYPAIQQGIDAAAPSDTILIWPGTYVEDLVIDQKDLTLASQYLMTGDTSLISNTILDGDSAFSILALYGPHTVHVTGLTFMHGYGHYSFEQGQWGGAITLKDTTGVQAKNCRFIENYGDRPTCIYAASYSSILVENSLFALNEGAEEGTNVIWNAWGNLSTIRSCEFIENIAGRTPLIILAPGEAVVVENCKINRNQGNYNESSSSMLLHAEADRMEVNDCDFSSNTLRRQPSLVDLRGWDSLFVKNCVFDSTICDHASDGNGNGYLVDIGADHTFLNNISIRNNNSTDGEEFGIGMRAYAYETLMADSIFVINNHEEFTYHEPGTSGLNLFSEGVNSLSHIYVVDNSALRSDLDEFPDETGCSQYITGIGGVAVTVEHLVKSGNINEFIQNSNGIRLSGAYQHQATYILNDILIGDNIRNHPDPANDEWSGMGSGIHTDNTYQRKIEINNLRIFNQQSTILGSAIYARCDTFLLTNAHISDSGNQPIKVSADHFRMENVLLHDCWNTRGEVSSHIVGGTVSGSGILRNCSIVDSYGDYGMGLYLSASNTTDEVYYLLENCIIENTCPTGDALGYWEDANITLNVNYSNIRGGWEGVGNIDADPMFTDPENDDYTFLPDSPCIDAGNPDPAYNDPEDPENQGWPLWPSQGMLRNDMGCYGGPGAIELWDYQEDVPVRYRPPVQPATIQLRQNYPNPFNPTTTIDFSLGEPGAVSLTVFNMAGHQVATLVDGNLSAGDHSVVFDGSSLTSGIYFYNLRAGDYTATQKMVLVK